MQNFSKSNSFGLLLGFSGYTIFVLLDSIIKKNLVHQYPVFEITFYICLFSFIPILITLAIVGNWDVLINPFQFPTIARVISIGIKENRQI